MNDNDKEEAQAAIISQARIRHLFQQATKLNRDSSNSNNSVSSSTCLTMGQRQIKHFLTECGLNSTAVNLTNTRPIRTIQEELAFYIDKVKSFKSFEELWRTYQMELPCLTALVRCYNIRPSSSVASESLFSVAAYVNRKQRCSLSPETLMYSMILRDAETVERLFLT
jgi:hypothetical protein